MTRRPDIYIEIALRGVRNAIQFIGDRTSTQYVNDLYCQSAVERQLEIAGDALGQLRKLDPALFEQIPDGPLIVAFRNVLAHGYATLDHHRVYGAATVQAVKLERTLAKLLENFADQ